MNVPLTVQNLGKYTVVEFHTNSLMDPLELELIAQTLYKLVDDQDHRWILLDFERVQFISSQCLGIILTLQKKLGAIPKSNFVLCGVGPRLKELLKITQLDRILKIKASQQDVIKSTN